MIVAISRINSHYQRVYPHHDGLEAWWLSPGALEFLRTNYGYRPWCVDIIPVVVLETMKMRGHLRKMRDAPPLGTFLEPFRMPPQSRACAIT